MEPAGAWRLTRDWDDGTSRSRPTSSARRCTARPTGTIVERVAQIADDRGVSRAQVALAWVLSHPAVSAPIVGATKEHHLDDAIASVDSQLTATRRSSLEEPYTPQPISGHA